MLKRIVLAIVLLYAFSVIGSGLSIFIPINIITVGLISIIGISGLLSLIAVYFALL
jgi:hypothetical protein